jgi:mannose-6-phosphate isomerase-like protein (cupin superfamily)
MATLIEAPVVIRAAGDPPKSIEEYWGRLHSRAARLSIARMLSPGGWTEPAQAPEFDECSVVLRGVLVVETRSGRIEVGAGQAVVVEGGEWVRYTTPYPEGAEYLAVCLPAFSPDIVHRDA